jgi:hypothetical protein
MVAANKEATKLHVPSSNVEIIILKVLHRYHDLESRCIIPVSQITSDMFRLL